MYIAYINKFIDQRQISQIYFDGADMMLAEVADASNDHIPSSTWRISSAIIASTGLGAFSVGFVGGGGLGSMRMVAARWSFWLLP
jgi:fatty acid-binding protein DegV